MMTRTVRRWANELGCEVRSAPGYPYTLVDAERCAASTPFTKRDSEGRERRVCRHHIEAMRTAAESAAGGVA